MKIKPRRSASHPGQRTPGGSELREGQRKEDRRLRGRQVRVQHEGERCGLCLRDDRRGVRVGQPHLHVQEAAVKLGGGDCGANRNICFSQERGENPWERGSLHREVFPGLTLHRPVPHVQWAEEEGPGGDNTQE